MQSAPLTFRSWQPGILPLRPLTFGDFLTVPFRAFRFARATVLGGPLVMTLASTAMAMVATWLLFTDPQLGLLDPYPVLVGMEPGTIIALAGSLLVWFASDMLASSMVLVGISRAVLGEKISFGAAWSLVVRRLGALALLYFLTSAAGLAAGLPGMLLFAWGIGAENAALIVTGVLLMVFISLPVGVIMAVYLPAARGAIVMEQAGAIPAIRRALRLMKGRFWWTLLILIVCGLIASVVAQIVQGFGQFVAIAGLLIAPENPVVFAIIFAAGYGLALMVSNVVTYAFLGTVYGLVYIDVRMRREGFDVELARYAEAQNSGRGTL